MVKRLGMLIDQERCIGCEACSIACRIENSTSYFWMRVETQGGTQKDTPKGTYPELTISFLPKLCNHCENPPCINSCPAEAIYKLNNGIVFLDKNECTGCKACLEACPYNIIVFDEDNNHAEKCNFCSHRIDQGLQPFCVICCEGQAIYFGNLKDSDSKISQKLSSKNTFRLKKEANTNPSVYYSPPKLKRRL